MNTGFSNNIAIPNINGLLDINATTVEASTIVLNGTDISTPLTQVPINSTNIAALQLATTGITYVPATDLTTIANNLTITGTLTTTPTLASQTYVNTQIANLVASAPLTLDTLNELATALGNDPNFATTTATLIGTKASLTASQTLSGVNLMNNTGNVFYGNGANLTGIVTAMPTNVMITNSATNQVVSGQSTFSNTSNSFSGSFIGSGAALTGITSTSLPTDVMYLGNTQISTGQKTFSNTLNSFTGSHTGSGAGLTGITSTSLPSTVMYNNAAQTITGINTFNAVPLCAVAPTTANMLCNKTYVDLKAPITTTVDLATAQTISAIKTFTAVPLCSVAPTTADMLCNKTYVDSSVPALTNYVTLNTEQTITANKTMSSSLIFSSGAATTTINETLSVLMATNNNTNGAFAFFSKDSAGNLRQPLNVNATQTALNTNLAISDKTATYTTNIDNVNQTTNISNPYNNGSSIQSFTGAIYALNKQGVIRNDGGAVPNGIIYGPGFNGGIYNPNYTITTTTRTYTGCSFRDNINIIVPTGADGLLAIGSYLTGSIVGLPPSLTVMAGTYIVSYGTIYANAYTLSQVINGSPSGASLSMTFQLSNINAPYVGTTFNTQQYTWYVDTGSSINTQITNTAGTLTNVIKCAPSGVSINSPLIGLSVPPYLTYSTLPTLSPFQVGYNYIIQGNYPATDTTLATGSFTSLKTGGFTLPAGVYNINFRTYLTHSGVAAGNIGFIQVGISTIPTGTTGNDYCWVQGTQNYTASFAYMLASNSLTLNVTTSTLYYFVIYVNYTGIVLQCNGVQNYLQYTKIA